MVQSSSDWSCAITFDYCELADWLGTTADNLRGNKFADLYAKEAVAIQKLSLPKIDDKNWQLWFAKVNAWLGATRPEKKKQDPPASENTKTKKRPLPHEICTFHPTDDFKSWLPKWNWSPVVEQFTWSPQCEDIPFPHTSLVKKVLHG